MEGGDGEVADYVAGGVAAGDYQAAYGGVLEDGAYGGGESFG